MLKRELETTIQKMAMRGKGLLAADESNPTITKRFAALGIECTEETRRTYRDLLITTTGLNEFIAGVILFEETLNQQTLAGTPFPEKLKSIGILPGIKVDKGLIPLENTVEEQVTQGLDGLPERLKDYKAKGAVFAKWRAVYAISNHTPSALVIKTNAECLARYAAMCQNQGIVPIVEPEILLDGDYTLERSAEVSEAVFRAVFHALYHHRVALEYMILKPSMVNSGKKMSHKATPEEVAETTVRVLRHTIPAAVPTINFLSGGQTPEEATANLNAINMVASLKPWNLSYSYARALQDYPMKIWHGDNNNKAAAQKAFHQRARLNSLAAVGKYKAAMEKETTVIA